MTLWIGNGAILKSFSQWKLKELIHGHWEAIAQRGIGRGQLSGVYCSGGDSPAFGG